MCRVNNIILEYHEDLIKKKLNSKINGKKVREPVSTIGTLILDIFRYFSSQNKKKTIRLINSRKVNHQGTTKK